MKTAAILLATALLGPFAMAQDYLEPEHGIFAGDSGRDYYAHVRQVFAPAYQPGVILRVVIIPSFHPELVVGLRSGEKGVEAFVTTPSCHIWNLELLHDYESGRITTAGKDGKEIPLEKNEAYQKLKQRTPGSLSEITTHTVAKTLPEPLAGQVALSDRIKAIWKRSLLDARHPAEPHGGADGVTYYFSMWIQGRGSLGGEIWSPDAHTRMHALITLVDQLAAYADGKAAARQLEDALKPLE